jgi:hypothetical protein
MAVLFILLTRAEVVELVDALRSGRSGSNPVGVRVPPSAPVQMRLSAIPCWGSEGLSQVESKQSKSLNRSNLRNNLS